MKSKLRNRTNLVDKYGKDYVVQFRQTRDSLVATLHYGRLRVGHAFVSINSKVAVLADIVVKDDVPVRSNWLRRLVFGRKKESYRGRGLGTAMLKAVIERLRASDTEQLEGEMHGDIMKLSKWYGAAGFTVDLATNKISRRL